MALLYNIILALAGIGVLLYGVRTLNNGLESVMGVRFKRALTKSASNKINAYGMGTAVTTVVQSSTLTLSMVSGFINVGAISLAEGISIVLGANLGSALSIVLLAFDTISLVKIFTILCLIGAIIYMFSKRTATQRIATTIMGFGLICLGLSLIGSNLGEIVNQPGIYEWISVLTHPVVLFLVGALICALTDSTYATMAVLIALVGTAAASGPMSITSAVTMLAGACFVGGITTFIYNVSNTSPDGKRSLVFYVLFKNLSGILLALSLLFNWVEPFYNLLGQQTGLTLILVYLITMLVVSLILLPFNKHLAKLLRKIVKSKPSTSSMYDKFVPDEKIVKIFGVAYPWMIGNIVQIMDMQNNLGQKIVMNLCDKESSERGIPGRIKALDKIIKLMNSNVIRISANQTENNIEKMNIIMGILNDTNHLNEKLNKIHQYSKEYEEKPRSMTVAEVESVFPLWMSLHGSLDLLIAMLTKAKDMDNKTRDKRMREIFSLSEQNIKDINKTKRALFKQTKCNTGFKDNSLYLNILFALENMNTDIANIAIKFGILESY